MSERKRISGCSNVAGSAQNGWVFPGSFVQNGSVITFGFTYATAFASYPNAEPVRARLQHCKQESLSNLSGYTVASGSQPVSKATLNAHFLAATNQTARQPSWSMPTARTSPTPTTQLARRTFITRTTRVLAGQPRSPSTPMPVPAMSQRRAWSSRLLAA